METISLGANVAGNPIEVFVSERATGACAEGSGDIPRLSTKEVRERGNHGHNSLIFREDITSLLLDEPT
ncbi:hypothetical protein [Sorangium sp. So ce1000]|uniref:hypothetical protein n=1 Tax=Sorangium sp. So ce1000 TaxID=3133325 RepID=UPI003F624210